MFPLPDAADARRSGHRVLVVDDEPTLRLGFAYALANPETVVETAATGKEALEQIAVSDYDLIIVDLRMPEMDGIGVIEALRGQAAILPRAAATPIVLCTGLTQPQAALRAIRYGVVDFLLKPMRPVDLRRMVEFVLHPERYPLSQALQGVRERRPGRAIAALECARGLDGRAASWLKVLCSIRDAPNGGAVPELAESVRNDFYRLAFNSPHDP